MTGHNRVDVDSIGSTSSTLIEKVRLHDQEAWRRLVRLYGPLVDFWISCSGLQFADAQDVFQEVFRAVAQGIDGFAKEQPTDSFRAWLRTITHNKLTDRYRQRRPKAAVGGSEAHERLQAIPQPQDTNSPSEAAAVRQLRLRALELIRGEFEDRTWQMFWAVVFDGKTPDEVARTFGVGPAAVRQAKSRVLRRLREELCDFWQE